MRESLAVAAVGLVFCAGIQLQLACLRHDHDVAQVGMPRAAQVRMAEAHNGVVGMLVAGTIVVDLAHVLSVHIVRDGVGVRTQLHNAEGRAGAGEGVAHALGSNHGIHVAGFIVGGSGVGGPCGQGHQCCEQEVSFHFGFPIISQYKCFVFSLPPSYTFFLICQNTSWRLWSQPIRKAPAVI